MADPARTWLTDPVTWEVTVLLGILALGALLLALCVDGWRDDR